MKDRKLPCVRNLRRWQKKEIKRVKMFAAAGNLAISNFPQNELDLAASVGRFSNKTATVACLLRALDAASAAKVRAVCSRMLADKCFLLQ